MLANELLKFRRSHFGVILLLIPGLSILLAAMNYQLNLRVLTPGWPSFLGQTTLFYGMLFMNVGIAILAATAWRREHKDNNATFLLTSPRTRGSIVVAKAGVLIVLVAVMQTVFFLLALAVGFILKVPGHPPLDVAVILLLAIIPWCGRGGMAILAVHDDQELHPAHRGGCWGVDSRGGTVGG
ncbi:ABC transporter permease [Corynebacterium cystitidis]|uniref:ABC transporter permease n=1 Tax=Corynebacterium cystitidis TaxID=35757 RepID=UPI00211E1DA6|nr:ABC transporter permease [Corynebacterium cystitidis]